MKALSGEQLIFVRKDREDIEIDEAQEFAEAFLEFLDSQGLEMYGQVALIQSNELDHFLDDINFADEDEEEDDIDNNGSGGLQ
jgi:hypothetical protein